MQQQPDGLPCVAGQISRCFCVPVHELRAASGKCPCAHHGSGACTALLRGEGALTVGCEGLRSTGPDDRRCRHDAARIPMGVCLSNSAGACRAPGGNVHALTTALQVVVNSLCYVMLLHILYALLLGRLAGVPVGFGAAPAAIDRALDAASK